jgi:hypothetical protein
MKCPRATVKTDNCRFSGVRGDHPGAPGGGAPVPAEVGFDVKDSCGSLNMAQFFVSKSPESFVRILSKTSMIKISRHDMIKERPVITTCCTIP